MYLARFIGGVRMGWRSRRAGKQALACLAVFAVGGLAGLLAGFGADPTDSSELSPAEVVALRFEGVDARDNATAAAEPTSFVLASADSQEFAGLLFNPNPVYPPQVRSAAVSAASAAPATRVVATRPSAPPPADLSLPPQLANVEPELPAEALAYAADDLPPRAAPAPVPTAPAPHPASASNAVLNSAQIASIKERLKLTSYQSTLWPPVESALRDISYQGGHDASHKTAGVVAHGGTIDPSSVPVQRLKSAAFPLLMSLNEDQKQEVRTMVRLMGLENLASQF
jgi:hypothetical protein